MTLTGWRGARIPFLAAETERRRVDRVKRRPLDGFGLSSSWRGEAEAIQSATSPERSRRWTASLTLAMTESGKVRSDRQQTV
ncbi:MAG: hypothetical protein PGN25_01445 [Methylorubrum populi]